MRTASLLMCYWCIIQGLSTFFCHHAVAQGNLLITPRRVVFDGTQRTRELNLANTGRDTARYLISMIEIRMNEDGTFETITQPDSGQRFASNINNIGISLRYDLAFGQVAVSALRGNSGSTLVQAARGGFLYDANTHYLTANNRINVGSGGIVLLPFLDINGNGQKDAGEIRVPGIKVSINTGRVITDDKDATVRILELEPYTSYFVDLSRSNFDNIAWKLSWQTMYVTIDPHRLKPIAVPVKVMGEVSGKVFLQDKETKREMARITVGFYREDGTMVAKTLTQADGYFSFLGLPPGAYTARIDAGQLTKLKLSAVPAIIPFTIKPRMDGDVVGGLEFVLH